jgi:6-pyruvoyl-tetrahydropterin synthase
MYRLAIEREFQASHALRMGDGQIEAAHQHDWHVRVEVEADQLNDVEFVMDFHELQVLVDRVLAPLEGVDLNDAPPLGGVNPSAERVAEHIYRCVAPQLPSPVRLRCVSVTEAPGCHASYLP